MRATEFIAELFQSGKDYKWEFRGSEEVFARFTVGDIEYLWAARVEDMRNPQTWTISFSRSGQVQQDKMFGLTGTGNSAEVMSTVIDITRQFLQEYGDKVLELRFSSKEESRTKLYVRMVKRLLPDWNLHTRNVRGDTDFYLTNPKAYDLEEDMTRRGFLGAMGAAAMSGAQAATGLKPPKEFTVLSNNPNNEIALQKIALGSGLKGVELAQFLAQMKHESWNFERLKEKPMGKGYFEKRYGIQHAPKTAKILGNKRPGDGERYHGRGFVQLTGRDNYRMASEALGIDLLNHPELAAKPDIAAKIAVWYWRTRVKPNVTNFKDTATVTKYINPAMRGLKDRHENFIDYYRILV